MKADTQYTQDQSGHGIYHTSRQPNWISSCSSTILCPQHQNVSHFRKSRTRGEISEEFAAVCSELWSGKCRSISPQNFRHVFGQYKKEFAGYEQQDSHEFLTILIDYLHSELEIQSDIVSTSGTQSHLKVLTMKYPIISIESKHGIESIGTGMAWFSEEQTEFCDETVLRSNSKHGKMSCVSTRKCHLRRFLEFKLWTAATQQTKRSKGMHGHVFRWWEDKRLVLSAL